MVEPIIVPNPSTENPTPMLTLIIVDINSSSLKLRDIDIH
jgi:hypothetical protein